MYLWLLSLLCCLFAVYSLETIKCTNETSYCGWTVHDRDPNIVWNISSDHDDIPYSPEGREYLLIKKSDYLYGNAEITFKSETYNIETSGDRWLKIWYWGEYPPLLQIGRQTMDRTEIMFSQRISTKNEWKKTTLFFSKHFLRQPFKIMLVVSLYHPFSRLALGKMEMADNESYISTTIKPYGNFTGYPTRRPDYSTPDYWTRSRYNYSTPGYWTWGPTFTTRRPYYISTIDWWRRITSDDGRRVPSIKLSAELSLYAKLNLTINERNA